MSQTTIEDIFIIQILREFPDDPPDEGKEFFLNANFGGIIDIERVETKEFFLGKNWREINFKQLSENVFFPGNLTDEGYAYYFPAILIAALFNDDYPGALYLLFNMKEKDPLIVLALSRLSEENRDLVFRILYYLAAEDCISYKQDNQIYFTRIFQLYIMNQRGNRMK